MTLTSSLTRCHVCDRPCEDEDEPYLVAMRNGMYVDACFWCWLKWPDLHKVIPGQPLRETA
jgi:hypothetical protein